MQQKVDKCYRSVGSYAVAGDARETGEYIRCTEGTEREVAETENGIEEPGNTWTCCKDRGRSTSEESNLRVDEGLRRLQVREDQI